MGQQLRLSMIAKNTPDLPISLLKLSSNNKNDILLDLRGYVQTDMPALAKRVGLSQQDFANTLTATCRELQNFVKNYVDKEHRA